MAEPFLSEIRIMSFGFAPKGWALCNGQLLPINQNQALFSLLGTTYGGDGQSTFALPDLRGRLPLHQGNSFILAETGGVEQVTLTVAQIPAHTHPLLATGNFADKPSPQGNVAAALGVPNVFAYGTDQPTTPVSPASVSSTGGSQPHTNFQPYLCVDFIISLFGIFPSQT